MLFYLLRDIEDRLWGHPVTSPCDVIDDVITMKYTFWHNLGRSFHISGQIEVVFNISNFQNGRHFEVTKNFLTNVIPEVDFTD